jgi:hypothetical protein
MSIRQVSVKWTCLAVAGSSPCRGRILDTAERVLIALRGCTLNQAFVEIVQTAKTHNVSTLSLADPLVALAQDQASQDGQDAAFDAARVTWGHLFVVARPNRGMRCGRDDDVSGV